MRSGFLQSGARFGLLLALVGCGLVLPGCSQPRRPLVTVTATYSIMRDPVALEAVARESAPVADTASGRVAGVVEPTNLR